MNASLTSVTAAAAILVVTSTAMAQREVCGRVLSAGCYDGIVEVLVEHAIEPVSFRFAGDVDKRAAHGLLYRKVCVPGSKRTALTVADIQLPDAAPLDPLDAGAAHPCDGRNITLPTVTRHQPVSFPPSARSGDTRGPVLIEAVIGPDGTLGATRILRTPPGNRELSDAAMRALRQWRFAPGTVDGAPAPVLMNFIFRFELE